MAVLIYTLSYLLSQTFRDVIFYRKFKMVAATMLNPPEVIVCESGVVYQQAKTDSN